LQEILETKAAVVASSTLTFQD